MRVVLRRELGSEMPWLPATVGYETVDPETVKRRTHESSMENLLIEQPQVLLSGLTGGLPVVVIKDFRLAPDRARGREGDWFGDTALIVVAALLLRELQEVFLHRRVRVPVLVALAKAAETYE